MSIPSQIMHMLGKELLTEWRQRSRISGVFWFALAVVLMVGFATPSSKVLEAVAGGTLWLGLLLASTRSLDQSYAVEHEHGAMEGLVLWPVDPIAVYYGKALANALVLIGVAFCLLPLLLAIFSAEVKGNWLELMGIVVLGCMAMAAPGTFYGLITSQARGSSVLLPLLLFPLVVPAILAASNATTKVFEGDPMEQVSAWMGILTVFNLIHWSLSGWLYGWVLED
ncbi:MAG: heme exporter protein CcmB [Myxococcales bacterium]|nr:heme exporter protein CcmB [Myxococcales bacterium]